MTASKLVRPAAEYQESFLEALREYHAEGRCLYQQIPVIKNDFSNFIKDLRTEKGCRHQPFQEWVDPVPETITWLVKDNEYLGTCQIRHRLNWHLEKWGGHIHFIIRPSRRQCGFGKKMLMKAMPIANHFGIDKALLTLDPDNAPAIRVAEACGAKFTDELPETGEFPARRRYWLDCT